MSIIEKLWYYCPKPVKRGAHYFGMARHSSRLIITLASLSVVVILIGAFTSLSLGGPATIAQTLTTKQVQWEFEKPSFSPDRALWLDSPDEVLVRNSYETDKINVTSVVCPLGFLFTDPFYGGSSVALNVNLTASVAGGYLENVRLTFNESYASSEVRLLALVAYGAHVPGHATVGNLTVTDAACLGFRETLLNGDTKAYVNAADVNSSREVMIDTGVTDWVLMAPANVSEQLEVSAQVTYFSGTDHVSVVLPTVLSMIPDAGNTLEDARAITAGSYAGTVSINWDPVDCYKIWLNKGQNVTISTVVCRLGANVSLLDPGGKSMGSVQSTWSLEPEVLDRIGWTVESEGYWYIQVSTTDDQGLYRLSVSVT